MFKICSIGCGNMARSGHGPAFKKYAETYPKLSEGQYHDAKHHITAKQYHSP